MHFVIKSCITKSYYKKKRKKKEVFLSESTKFCESARIPQNTVRIPVFSKSAHRIRRPSEYHSRIPRRIRGRIPYSSSYSEYGKEYGIVHAEYAQNTRKSAF